MPGCASLPTKRGSHSLAMVAAKSAALDGPQQTNIIALVSLSSISFRGASFVSQTQSRSAGSVDDSDPSKDMNRVALHKLN